MENKFLKFCQFCCQHPNIFSKFISDSHEKKIRFSTNTLDESIHINHKLIDTIKFTPEDIYVTCKLDNACGYDYSYLRLVLI